MALVEIVGVLSLATDLGTGLPIEHAIRSCLIGLRLASYAGLDEAARADVFYVTLLRMLGCTADSREAASYFGDELAFGRDTATLDLGNPAEVMPWLATSFAKDDPPRVRERRIARLSEFTPERRRETLAGHCEVAQSLARQLTMPSSVVRGLGYVFERWDGTGAPAGVRGSDIPVPVRVMALAAELDSQAQAHGAEAATAMARGRADTAFDPELVSIVLGHAGEILGGPGVEPAWAAMVEAEPRPRRRLHGQQLDAALQAIADFGDQKSSHTLGHSRRVAELAASAARSVDARAGDIELVRRAGLIHDLGRVAISSSIWDKAAPLDETEREQVRLHPYYSERLATRGAGLIPAGRLAGSHHERLDGSGYHRGAPAASLPALARILAAADAYTAMTESRAFRPALDPARSAGEIARDVADGRLDAGAASAVLAAANAPPTILRPTWPDGLTDREVDVLRLVARGLTTAEMGAELRISPKTVDRHLQNTYNKLDVETRAGATLYAVQHGLLTDI